MAMRMKRAIKRIQSRSTKKTVPPTSTKPGTTVSVTNGWPARTIPYALIGIVAIATLIGVPSLLLQSDSTTAATQSATSASAMTSRSSQASSSSKAAVRAAVTSAPHAEPTTGTDARNAPGVVTISGCLEGGDDSFWLKDTAGANAPRARSWKSGFLTKRSASIQVVDRADALNLSKYVGQRVAATGALTDRTLQARSLHRVAASCN